MEHDFENVQSRLVTGDEKWIYHYVLESNCQSMERQHPSFPRPKEFKSLRSVKKAIKTQCSGMQRALPVFTSGEPDVDHWCLPHRDIPQVKSLYPKKHRGLLRAVVC